MKFIRKRRLEAVVVVLFGISLLWAATAGREYEGKTYSGPITGKDVVAKERSVREKVREILPQTFIKVGFVQAGHESDWRIAVTKSCMETFCEENGYELYFVDADGRPEVQVSAVRNFIQDQVDYILIDPILPTGWTAALKEAYHADIPVFLLNGKIDCKERYYKAWYGPDYVSEGECAGQWLQKCLISMGQSSRIIRILILNGTAGDMERAGRMEGFAQYMERNRNWKILAQDDENSNQSTSKQILEECLEKYPDVDVVICQNDHVALEACKTLEEAGRSYGADGEIMVVSFGATKEGLKAVFQGKINAEFECSPLSPAYASQAIQRLEAGDILEKKIYFLPEKCYAPDSSTFLVTSDGVKEMIPVTEELLKNRKY